MPRKAIPSCRPTERIRPFPCRRIPRSVCSDIFSIVFSPDVSGREACTAVLSSASTAPASTGLPAIRPTCHESSDGSPCDARSTSLRGNHDSRFRIGIVPIHLAAYHRTARTKDRILQGRPRIHRPSTTASIQDSRKFHRDPYIGQLSSCPDDTPVVRNPQPHTDTNQ